MHYCNATKFNCYHTVARVSLPYYSVFHKGKPELKKADLDGTTFASDCRMRFLERCSRHAKNRTQLSSFNIAYTYDCRRILKHVLKSYDIFCDVHDSRKRVVGFISTK